VLDYGVLGIWRSGTHHGEILLQADAVVSKV
jgi:hypothetical protein